jgi:CheY-like chemotaxis protein
MRTAYRDTSSVSHDWMPGTASGSISNNAATILVVDDDEGICELISALLIPLGYHVFIAPDGEAAMAIVDAEGAPKIDLLLTDYRMPFMRGDELVLRFRQSHPNAAIIMISSESPQLEPALRCEVLAKPFHTYELTEKVKAALADHSLA